MKTYILPNDEKLSKVIVRPTLAVEDLDDLVWDILKNVKENGDKALIEYNKKFNQFDAVDFRVSHEELKNSEKNISVELKNAIALAAANIKKFHSNQRITEEKIETTKGVSCWRKSIAIEKVGLYIPGGSAPLFSTVLMLAIPAIIAGCKEIILCTPANSEGKINEAILFTANFLGIEKIYKIGGAQAIAAMAYGTESISKVYKIFGPGNQFVTKAKTLIQNEGIAIDMPAGPSEVLVIADASCDPDFVAADLLSQAEHGTDSQVVLLSDSQGVLNNVQMAIEKPLAVLPRKALAAKTLENSYFIQLESIEKCLEFSNEYAPEHLILALDNAENHIDLIVNAGSVFLGHYSCESAGDYASGTNHTLPTNGFAKSYSGVSVDSFVKRVTFQKLSADGLQNIGPAIEEMAAAEQLEAHKNAVSIRLKKLNS